MMQRVQRIIAQAGIVSRRNAEELIRQGRVLVNGKTAVLGQQADPAKDRIEVDGEKIRLEQKVYVMLHKPSGYVTTVAEQFGMRTVMQLIDVPARVYPVGRLDRDAEGLVLLTNDGDVANRIMHPRYGFDKEYIIVLNAPLDKDREVKVRRGMVIEGRRVVPTYFEKIDDHNVVLAIHEGRKHIVKRVFERLGFRVVRLKRVRIGPLVLRGVKRGKWRYLAQEEVQELRRATGVRRQ